MWALLFIWCPQWAEPIRFMVFNATFHNISAISWQTVLMVKETQVPRENHRPVTRQQISHNVVSSTPRHERSSNSQFYWWYALNAQVVVYPPTIWSWPFGTVDKYALNTTL
jgi:hypothetical protein